MLFLVKFYDNKMVKSPYNCVIFPLTQPQVANQKKPLSFVLLFAPLLFSLFSLFFCLFLSWCVSLSLSLFLCACVCVCVCVCVRERERGRERDAKVVSLKGFSVLKIELYLFGVPFIWSFHVYISQF